jgi:hypothetical protein
VRAAHIESVHVGQGEIEHDRVELVGALRDPCLPQCGGDDAEARLAEIFAEHPGEARVVLD